jgi:hypothetical protein
VNSLCVLPPCCNPEPNEHLLRPFSHRLDSVGRLLSKQSEAPVRTTRANRVCTAAPLFGPPSHTGFLGRVWAACPEEHVAAGEEDGSRTGWPVRTLLSLLELRPTSPLGGCNSLSAFSAYCPPSWLGSNITTHTKGGSIGLSAGYSPTYHRCNITTQVGSCLLKSSYLGVYFLKDSCRVHARDYSNAASFLLLGFFLVSSQIFPPLASPSWEICV